MIRWNPWGGDLELEGPSGEVTLLLARMKAGDAAAVDRLTPLVYDELRRLARHYMRAERGNHTLQPTALVHEVFLRLVHQDTAALHNRAQFIGVAAQSMRRLLVDHARRKMSVKRAGAVVRIAEDSRIAIAGQAGDPVEVLAVDRALQSLAEMDAQQARIVELRYFGGLTVEETADALEISPRTVKREWSMAKAWLRSRLGESGS